MTLSNPVEKLALIKFIGDISDAEAAVFGSNAKVVVPTNGRLYISGYNELIADGYDDSTDDTEPIPDDATAFDQHGGVVSRKANTVVMRLPVTATSTTEPVKVVAAEITKGHSRALPSCADKPCPG